MKRKSMQEMQRGNCIKKIFLQNISMEGKNENKERKTYITETNKLHYHSRNFVLFNVLLKSFYIFRK